MALPTLNVLSICSGTGGLDIGVRLAVPAARTVCYVEREAFCVEILATRMQQGFLDDAPVFSDAATFRGKPWRGIVDCIIAGYPCQPFSTAGKRRGVDDERHLWPHISRIIGECKPWLCFFENVPGHVALGLSEVAADLRRLGYVVPRPILLEAATVGASHKRERLFILAYSERYRRQQSTSVLRKGQSQPAGSGKDLADGEKSRGRPIPESKRRLDATDVDRSGRDVANSGCSNLQRRGESGDVSGPASGPESEGHQRQWLRDTAGDGEPIVVHAEHSPSRNGRSGEESGQAIGERRGLHGPVDAGGVLGRCQAFIQCERPATRIIEFGQYQYRGKRIGVCDECFRWREQQRMGDTCQSGFSRRSGEPGDDGQERPAAERAGGEFLGHTDGERRQQAVSRQPQDIGPFPPGPQSAEWRAIIADAPHLAPAIEPGVRVLADGYAYVVDESRVDQLRAGGNGVVPLQAALALRLLARRAGITI